MWGCGFALLALLALLVTMREPKWAEMMRLLQLESISS